MNKKNKRFDSSKLTNKSNKKIKFFCKSCLNIISAGIMFSRKIANPREIQICVLLRLIHLNGSHIASFNYQIKAI